MICNQNPQENPMESQENSDITPEQAILDERYMRNAIDQAYIAEENGDVPIGAIIVHKNRIIAKAYNQREQLNDATAHAEIIALTQASDFLKKWRLLSVIMPLYLTYSLGIIHPSRYRTVSVVWYR